MTSSKTAERARSIGSALLSNNWFRGALFFAFCYAFTVVLGKDINPDLLNYHLYIAHAFINGQYHVDYFSTGATSYLNPIGYLPIYYMISWEWPPIIAAAALSGFHAMNLVALWKLCKDHLFSTSSHKLSFSLIAVILGAISPVFLGMLGSSFLDPITSAMILFALYYCLNALRGSNNPARAVLLAGVLCGIASGLKLTSIPFALALGVVLLVGSRLENLPRFLAAYACGGIAGFMVSGGWWAAMLWHEYGNPLFPLFNTIFKSPDFAITSLSHDRFSPRSILDLITLPFRMAKLNGGIYVEIVAPDIRFALLVVAAFLAALITAKRKLAHTSIDPDISSPTLSLRQSALGLCLLFFSISWVLLQYALSGNGRYAISILLLAGPLLACLIRLIFPKERTAILLAVTVLSAQLVHAFQVGPVRWDTAPWTAHWLDWDIPPKLAKNETGYLSLSTSLHSYFMLGTAKGSGLVNLMGFQPISPRQRGAERVNAFIKHYKGRLRMIMRADELADAEAVRRREFNLDMLATAGSMLAPWNLRIDRGDCVYLSISTLGEKRLFTGASPSDASPSKYAYAMVSCAVLEGADAAFQHEEEREKILAIFEAISASCPLLFPSPGGFPVKLGEAWVKRFASTDTMLAVFRGRTEYSRYPYGPFSVDLGPAEAWLSTPVPAIKCEKSPRPW